MAESKIAAYLGFARRAGKLSVGVNAAWACKKDVFLLVADPTASENTKKEIGKLARRFSCPVIELAGLEDLTGKANCKLVAVREEHLAAAVISAAESAGE